MQKAIKQMFASAIDVLFSSDCPVCKIEKVTYPNHICLQCMDEMLHGQSFIVGSSRRVSKIISCRAYYGVLRECIRHLKYYKRPHMIDVFEGIIEEMLEKEEDFFSCPDIVVPVPLHKDKMRQRGFNQSELIAGIISEISSIPSMSKSLVKTKKTPPQNELTRKLRIENLKNAFRVIGSHDVKGKNILIVDDVITTGATLDVCAECLLDVGAKSVTAFTLAKAI